MRPDVRKGRLRRAALRREIHARREVLVAGGCDGASDALVSLCWENVCANSRGIPARFPDFIAVFADKAQFLTAGEDKTLRLWNAENGQCMWSTCATAFRVSTRVALSPDSRFIFSGGMEGSNSHVKVWEASTGKLLHTISCPHAKGISAVTLSADGCRLLTGSEDRFLRVWDIEWELLSNDPLSALTAQFRKPVVAGSPPSGVSPVSGFIKRRRGKTLRPNSVGTCRTRPEEIQAVDFPG